jgi:hypothetical protein
MLYDNSNPLVKEQFLLRARKLADTGKMVEMTEKKPQRTLKQNAYLWLLLSYWATQTGYTKEEAEAIYKDVNKDIYIEVKEIGGREVEYVRHTYELDTAEMTSTIEKFRNWSVMNDAYPAGRSTLLEFQS